MAGRNLDFDSYKVYNQVQQVKVLTEPYDLTNSDYAIVSPGHALTISAPAGNAGRVYIIKNTSPNTAFSVTEYSLIPIVPATVHFSVPANSCVHVISTGTAWEDISASAGA